MFKLKNVYISIRKKSSVVILMENSELKMKQRTELEKKKKSSKKEEISVNVVYGEKSLKECMKSVLKLQM